MNTNTLTKDYVQELDNAVAKVTQDNLASLRTQQINIATQVEGHLNKLIKAIQDVKATVEADTYGVDPSIPLVTLELVSPIKVMIQRKALEAEAETSAGPDDNNTQIDLSKLALNEVYEIQHVAASKIQLREIVVAYQATK